jgi:hypothetical protein
MKKIITLRFRVLPLAVHLSFFKDLKVRLLAAGEAILEAIEPFMAEFNLRLQEEDAVYYWERKSQLTKLINAADKELQRVMVVIRSTVQIGRHSTLSAVKASGEKVYDMMKRYGDMTREPYPAQVGALEELLAHFTGDCAHDVDNLGLGIPVQLLGVALTTFKNLLRQRDDETIEKPANTARQARMHMEAAYRSIVNVIDLNAQIGESPAFADFIEHLNPEIIRLNTEYNRPKKDIGEPGCLFVPYAGVWIYTGKPIVFIPAEVIYRENKTEPLENLNFLEDYTVTFKNNTDVGQAEYTIHGKGKYKGQATRTFEIAREPIPTTQEEKTKEPATDNDN